MPGTVDFHRINRKGRLSVSAHLLEEWLGGKKLVLLIEAADRKCSSSFR